MKYALVLLLCSTAWGQTKCKVQGNLCVNAATGKADPTCICAAPKDYLEHDQYPNAYIPVGGPVIYTPPVKPQPKQWDWQSRASKRPSCQSLVSGNKTVWVIEGDKTQYPTFTACDDAYSAMMKQQAAPIKVVSFSAPIEPRDCNGFDGTCEEKPVGKHIAMCGHEELGADCWELPPNTSLIEIDPNASKIPEGLVVPIADSHDAHEPCQMNAGAIWNFPVATQITCNNGRFFIDQTPSATTTGVK